MAEATFPSRQQIAAAQLEEMRRLLREVSRGNDFYRKKFPDRQRWDAVKDLPDFYSQAGFTTKQELVENQAASPPYGTNLTFSIERYSRCHQTSGTSGAPLRWLDTPESWHWMVRSWIEVYRAAEVSSADRVYFAFSFGPFIGFWLAFEAAAELGCLCLPGGGLSSTARLRAILEHGATVLCCTPTYAMRLAEVAVEEGIDLSASRVRRIMVAGEPGGSIPATRQRLEHLWPGARVFDHHGMTEVGPVTFECPQEPGLLHVIERAYLAEIINPASGAHVEPGETGELVLTTLGRVGSPLLRYRTGDLVKARPASDSRDGRCACGRSELALEGGILGRIDDMVIVRGVNIYPSAIEGLVRGSGDVAEYQVEVTSERALTELRVQVEPMEGLHDTSGLASRLERAFLNAFSLRIPVTVVPRGTLPRFELKAARWVRK